jgi:acetoacetate decarboxylase
MGPIPNSPGGLSYNLKLIPSADKNSQIAIKQLTTAVVRDISVQKLAFGEAQLVLGGSDLDPLDQIPVKKILKAYYAESDFILDYGEIVYDYLKQVKK